MTELILDAAESLAKHGVEPPELDRQREPVLTRHRDRYLLEALPSLRSDDDALDTYDREEEFLTRRKASIAVAGPR